MNGLKVQDFHGKQAIGSRDVAQMVERSHYELLKSIRQYGEYLAEGEIPVGDFFIECTYLDGNNQPRPNFLITKKGCDMIANKTTGKKGVLFTAAYVTAFEKMRERIEKDKLPPDKESLAEAKLNNSRARLASVWLKLAQVNPVPEYRQICAHYASAELTGGTAVLPLPEVSERTYSAKIKSNQI